MSYAKEVTSTDYTYCDPKFLDRRNITAEHLRFYAHNCRVLANYMDALPSSEHYQGTWVHDSIESPKCGTPACALGHAAFSNEIPGLQFGVNGIDDIYQIVAPVINGGRVGGDGHEDATDAWPKAGPYFFGRAVQSQVFNNGGLSKTRVSQKLRAYANKYLRRAKKLEKGKLPLKAWEVADDYKLSSD
jgi:hypothetical protein